jgi:endonuclease/exonuclease/phosphatase family metal-dependent hydrolase
MAQAQALAALHSQACLQAAHPPQDDETGAPFQNKVRTASAIVCGDFNLETTDPEYGVIQALPEGGVTRLADAWPVKHGNTPHAPTFRLFDRRYGPVPISCDFVFMSEDLKPRVAQVAVNTVTRASDHQPVLLELV